MNKTVTINLSGMVFHIDENAFDVLKRYLDNLKAHFANTQGREEIIADIESRMAEMFTEKVNDSKNVIMIDDVNAVIAIMGKPEEVAGEEQETSSQSKGPQSEYHETSKKRFYRNPDDRVLAGVCSGISAYFDIDPIWLRLAFGLSILFAGTGVFIYIILWVIIPTAKTASEKLQMRGERVNIQNIEKNVREEMENVKKRGEEFAKNISSEETKAKVKSATNKFGNFFGDVFHALGRFIAAIVGFIAVVISMAVLIGLSITIFSGVGVLRFTAPHTVADMVLSYRQLWWLIAGTMLAIGIPFTLLLLNGLKLLFRVKLNLKMIGAIMAGFWVIGLGICIITGIALASEFEKAATSGPQTENIVVTRGKPIVLKTSQSFEFDDELDHNHGHIGFMTDWFALNNHGDSVMSHLVCVNIVPSENDSAYLVVTSYARGKTYDEASGLAKDIRYNFHVTGSEILLSDFFTMSTHDKFRGQYVRVTVKLPAGDSVMLDRSLGYMLNNVENTTDTWDHDMIGHTWKMTKDGLECTDCTEADKKEWKKEGAHVPVGPTGVDVQTN